MNEENQREEQGQRTGLLEALRSGQQSARLKVKSKRGTGTRDSDEVTMEIEASNLDELVDATEDFLNHLELVMYQVRGVDPDFEE